MIFEGKEVKVLLARAGSGKCEPNSTVLPTPTGFRKVGDIKVGDYLFDREGKPTKVLGVYPQGEKEIYQLTFGDGRKARCGEEHLWTIVTPERSIKSLTVKEMLEKPLKMKNRSARYYIPCNTKGVEYSDTIKHELPLDPYALGVILGNGCLSSETYFTVSSNDPVVIERVAGTLKLKAKRRSKNNYSWDFFDMQGKHVRTESIVPAELVSKKSYEKHIPQEYLFATREQRLELLKGLMDTDGCISCLGGRYNCTYSTTSEQLKTDFETLCLSLGYVCHIRKDKRTEKYTKGVAYTIGLNIDNKDKVNLFWLPRKWEKAKKAAEVTKHRHYDIVSVVKIEDLGYKEESTCFYVDNEEHLYLTKDFVVTHNTSRLISIIAEELKDRRPEEIAFVTFTRKGAEEGLRRTCEKYRLTPDDLPYFKTLHSLTFHALNLKANQMFNRIHQRTFNKLYGYSLNRVEAETKKVVASVDSRLLDFYDMERSGALTSRQLAEADIELRYYHQLVHDYEEFKADNHLVDFFDCLIDYVRVGVSLPCKVVIIDECFSPETQVRMADGTIKEIKDIKVGDYVQGTKGATRVTAVHTGTDTMYDVVPYKQKKALFTCNSQHLIQAKATGNWRKAHEIKRARVTVQDKITVQDSEYPMKITFPCRLVKKGSGEYVGITVDSDDHLFLLANGCVVHNCQDLTMLQWQVVNQAFKGAEKIYLAGDSEQSIYKYSGARPDCLLKLAKTYPTEYLSASYRIPRKVYELAKGIVNMISEKAEMPFDFREGNIDGNVTKMSELSRVVNLIDERTFKNETTAQWYILARNNYSLARAHRELEERIIPYWTADGFFMSSEVINRLNDYNNFGLEGYKNEARKKKFIDKFGITDFSKHFTETNLFTEERKWVYNAYIEKYGLERLREMSKWNPPLLVSTIHHVKGGEADNVAVLLDATKKVRGNFFNDIDEELRILYVAVTRAKQNLYLVDSVDGNGFDEIINTIIDENGLDI